MSTFYLLCPSSGQSSVAGFARRPPTAHHTDPLLTMTQGTYKFSDKINKTSSIILVHLSTSVCSSLPGILQTNIVEAMEVRAQKAHTRLPMQVKLWDLCALDEHT